MRFKRIGLALGLSSLLVITTNLTGPAREPTPIIPVPIELFSPVPEPLRIENILPEESITPIETATPAPSKIAPKATPKPIKTTIKVVKPIRTSHFLLDRNVSWYGPHFYGKRTACGLALTKTLLGVAHKTLPCGTRVTFSWKGRTITVPVVDRGPYVAGRQWDLTGGLCVALNHCFTGPIYYRIGK